MKSQKSKKFSINLRNEMFSDSTVVDKSRNHARSRGDQTEKSSQFDQRKLTAHERLHKFFDTMKASLEEFGEIDRF